MGILFQDIETLQRQLRSKQISARTIIDAHLERIASTNSKLNAFLVVDEAGALKRADELDQRIAAGEPLKLLDGIPVGVKDVLVTETMPTTCGSRLLDGFYSPYTATAVARLESAGAIIVGKLNNDEFAMGSSTENSGYGPTRNPWDITRTPGGSSGGSAAAVAAGQVVAALGTDTGGSIRQPASYCGVVGIKPTYGRVSRYGLVAFASSLDQIGPLAHNAADCGKVLQAISGWDRADSTSANAPVDDYQNLGMPDFRGLSIGLPTEYGGDGLDPSVSDAMADLVETCRRLGATVKSVSLPHTDYAIATYYLIATAEASSNLARFDGVRYGHREPGKSLIQLYKNTRKFGFGSEVKRRIMLGTYALSAGYYDAYYKKAQQVRTLIRRDFDRVFESVDLLLTPTVPAPAFALGALVDDPLQMYLGDIFTVTANLAGLPAISFPCGYAANGLPHGAQLIGRTFDERRLLQTTAAIESATKNRRRLAQLTGD